LGRALQQYFHSFPIKVDNVFLTFVAVGVTWIGAEAASKIPNATRPLPDDPDRYIVELDVFHQIHCLNSVRKALYRERYKNDWRDLYKNGEFDYTSVDANHLGMQYLFLCQVKNI
jgi:hypothetical protein